MYSKHSRQAGSVAVMVAVSMTVLLACVGLAIDTATAYMVRDKLNAATDAASLAGARAVSQGKDETTQRANAQAAAIRFFNANYPTNYMTATDVTEGFSGDTPSTRRNEIGMVACAEMLMVTIPLLNTTLGVFSVAFAVM